MSAAAMRKDSSRPSEIDVELRRRPARARQPDRLDGQASTLRQMLSTLESLTEAGQRHSMGKIVAFLSAHVPHDGRELGAANREALVHLLLSLARESQRYAPDAPLFCRQAESIMLLMGALAYQDRS